MAEKTSEQQFFIKEAEIFIDRIRNSLCMQKPTLSLLEDSAQAVTTFKGATAGIEVGSFCSIVDRLELIFNRHLTDQITPNSIELETIELAIDWLAQLAILYGEQLPEPKSLVAELLYTFDLVESSRDAVSLAALVADQTKTPDVDPFLEDPKFDVGTRSVSSHGDPFADDPGFGLEFDLLQRTINFVAEKKKIEVDPFGVDPPLSNKPDTQV